MSYCPRCQTEGRVLKDRRLSRLLSERGVRRAASAARTDPGASSQGKWPDAGTTVRNAAGESSTLARAAWPQGIGLPAPAITP